jgi:hypothetical protein
MHTSTAEIHISLQMAQDRLSDSNSLIQPGSAFSNPAHSQQCGLPRNADPRTQVLTIHRQGLVVFTSVLIAQHRYSTAHIGQSTYVSTVALNVQYTWKTFHAESALSGAMLLHNP